MAPDLRTFMSEVPGGQRRVSKLLQERLQALQEMYGPSAKVSTSWAEALNLQSAHAGLLFAAGYKPHTTQEYEDFTWQIHEEMAERDIAACLQQRAQATLHFSQSMCPTISEVTSFAT